MPSLINHHAQKSTKMLLMGESSSGKTGALVSLVEAGWNLAIIDFDNGLEIITNILKEKKPELLNNIKYVTCTNAFHSIGKLVLPIGVPNAFTKGMKNLTKWEDQEDGIGIPSQLDPEKWIVVIDSLYFAGKAAMLEVLAMNGKLGQNPSQPNWGDAQRLIDGLLQLLCSEVFKPNVIVISHIKYVGGDESDPIIRGFPAAVGRQLAQDTPKYFNTVCLAKTQGTGSAAKKHIHTVSEGVVELKNAAAPGKLPAKLPLESGLATIFKTLQGK